MSTLIFVRWLLTYRLFFLRNLVHVCHPSRSRRVCLSNRILCSTSPNFGILVKNKVFWKDLFFLLRLCCSWLHLLFTILSCFYVLFSFLSLRLIFWTTFLKEWNGNLSYGTLLTIIYINITNIIITVTTDFLWKQLFRPTKMVNQKTVVWVSEGIFYCFADRTWSSSYPHSNSSVQANSQRSAQI